MAMLSTGNTHATVPPFFSKFVKKAHKPFQLAIEDAVDEVSVRPEIGEAKVGDLTGIRIYKFRFNRQKYLMAYRAHSNTTGGEID